MLNIVENAELICTNMLGSIIDKNKVVKNDIDIITSFIPKLFNGGNVTSESLSKVLNHLFSKIDECRSNELFINRQTSSIEFNIGTDNVSLKDALIILQYMKEKESILNLCIDSASSNIDIVSLLQQRDKVSEECQILSNEINKVLWSKDG